MIRSAAAQDIVAFLGILEPKNWPECLMLLVNQLDDQDAVHQEVCFPLRSPPFLVFLDVGHTRAMRHRPVEGNSTCPPALNGGDVHPLITRGARIPICAWSITPRRGIADIKLREGVCEI